VRGGNRLSGAKRKLRSCFYFVASLRCATGPAVARIVLFIFRDGTTEVIPCYV
jgi:hypothetical protein